jgi:hypothetical protein
VLQYAAMLGAQYTQRVIKIRGQGVIHHSILSGVLSR